MLVNRLGNYPLQYSCPDLNESICRLCDGLAITDHAGDPLRQEALHHQEEDQDQEAECWRSCHLSSSIDLLMAR